MEYVGKLGNIFSSVQTFYNEINPATLSGAIDIIVVEQEDGELACSPFHVRFGKLSLLMPQEKKIEIKVNDQSVPYLMKVSEAGESFFVFETEHEVPEEFQTSPIVGAMMESKPDEEPPFLDIGASKENKVLDTALEEDQFDLTEEDNKPTMPVPPELQSPKMIIEEQMDKVVTTMDPYSQDPDLPHDQNLVPRNDLYPLEDGSSLLERVIPEAITTTTIAKETFIVRPLHGDVDSKLMEVTHRATHQRANHPGPDSEPLPATHPDLPPGDQLDNHNQSIMLDIAGYKTGEDQPEADASLATPLSPSDPTGDAVVAEPAYLPTAPAETPSSTWGWGKRRRSVSEVEGPASPLTAQPSDTADGNDSQNVLRMVPGQVYRIELSLCGLNAFGPHEAENAFVFDQHQITYDALMHTPNLLNDKRLVFRYEHRYFATTHNGPLLTSLLLYKKPLQQHDHDQPPADPSASESLPDTAQPDLQEKPQPADHHQPDSRESYLFGKGWRQWLNRSSVASSSPHDDQAAPTGKEDDVTTTYTTTTKTTTVGWNEQHDHHHHHTLAANVPLSEDTDNLSIMTGDVLAERRPSALALLEEEEEEEEEAIVVDDGIPLSPTGMILRKHYAKTLRLTSEQLKQLHLKKGANTITFSVTSAYQGTATCAAKIFFWDYDESVVISDIDGTITKSDALGHVFTMIGKDWTHTGVARLYTDIVNNGYRILYLTSRAIGQADYTRDYLKKVEQDHYQLPDGPVIMSPDRLFTSFHREVIMRKPEVFKMACLKDIQRLFGGRDPFYAGFGNRITDAISYRSVNVPSSRIFTIDTQSSVRLELLRSFTSSYIDLNDLVDQIFPPVTNKEDETDVSYNDWNFWKQPLPDIPLPEELLPAQSPPTSPKPIPIKPDLKPLPTQATVTAEKPAPSKSRLLRSLTAISSASTSTLSLSASHHDGPSSALSSPHSSSPPSPQQPSATLSPELTIDAPSNATTPEPTSPPLSPPPSSPPLPPASSTTADSNHLAPAARTRVHSFTETLRRPSLLLLGTKAMPIPEEPILPSPPLQDEPDTMSALDPPLPAPASTTSSLMGGLRHTLSRTFAYGQDDSKKDQPIPVDPSKDDTSIIDDLVDDDDEEFDIEDIEHDMDDIPFI